MRGAGGPGAVTCTHVETGVEPWKSVRTKEWQRPQLPLPIPPCGLGWARGTGGRGVQDEGVKISGGDYGMCVLVFVFVSHNPTLLLLAIN